MSSSESAIEPSGTFRPGALRPDVEHSERVINSPEWDDTALALRKAWGLYLFLAILPPLMMILSIFYLIFNPADWFDPRVGTAQNLAGWWSFLGGMIWISISVPVGFLIRGRYWSAYDRGELVQPRDFHMGNLAVWVPLVLAGMVGFIAFAATEYVANLFTSVTAFIIFLAMHPTGHVMTRPIGDHDDPGVYEEPG